MEARYLVPKHGSKPSRGKFGPLAAHIWIGEDTACRMWSTGGISQRKYQQAESADGLALCQICKNKAVKRFGVLKPSRRADHAALLRQAHAALIKAYDCAPFDEVQHAIEDIEAALNIGPEPEPYDGDNEDIPPWVDA